MKKKTSLPLGMAAALFAALFAPGWTSTEVYAQSQSAVSTSVQVQSPTFPVVVNGVIVQGQEQSYPILIYKGITYIPLSPSYTDALGLSVRWNENTGLFIDDVGRSKGKWTPQPAAVSAAKEEGSSSYTVSIPRFPIHVNGKSIHNTSETYPFLFYNDITYMPLSWKLTHTEFAWMTTWDADKGLQIVSEQEKLLYHILYDDQDFLYLDVGKHGLVKFSKSLTEPLSAIRVDETEEAVIREKASGRKENKRFVPNEADPADIVQNVVQYHGKPLFSLAPYEAKAEAFYSVQTEFENKGIAIVSSAMTLDSSKTLVSVSVSYLQHIPAPYTPFEHRLFLVDYAEVKEITGMTQRPTHVYSNKDGSWWVISEADEEISVRSKHLNGEAVLIKKDGTHVSLNEMWDVKDVDVIRATEEGIYAKAMNNRYKVYYETFVPLTAEQKEIYYFIDSTGAARQIVEYKGVGGGYIDNNGSLFVVDRKLNKISNLTTGKTKMWWDYDLREQLKKK